MGHARALLNLPSEDMQDEFCRVIVDKQFSVRMTETLVKNFFAEEQKPQTVKSQDEPAEDPNVRAAVAEMEAALGTRVRLSRKANGGGRLEVDFYSADDLDRIYAVIVKQ
jgi:ParB family chromosome partitioning protein